MGCARLLFLLVSMLAEDTIELKIAEVINSSIENMGYELVRVKMQGSGGAKALQIMIDRIDGKAINVDDCERVSRQISVVLDVEDPIADPYDLQVSSPGLDRPLTREKDFVKYAGSDIKLESRTKINGQAKFRGKLVGVENGNIVVDLNIADLVNSNVSKKLEIAFDNIKNAKIVF